MLYVMEGMNCMELAVGNDTDENLWVRLNRKKNIKWILLWVSTRDQSARMMTLMKYSIKN